LTILILFGTLVIHELIHGLFFKVICAPKSKIYFGFKNGLIYAFTPNCVYSA